MHDMYNIKVNMLSSLATLQVFLVIRLDLITNLFTTICLEPVPYMLPNTVKNYKCEHTLRQ